MVARTRLNVPLYVHCLSCESLAAVNLRSPFFSDVAQRLLGDWATAHWRDATPYTPFYALLFVNIHPPSLKHDRNWNAVGGSGFRCVQPRSSFFRYVTLCRLVVGYRRFGTTYRSHLQGSSVTSKKSEGLKCCRYGKRTPQWCGTQESHGSSFPHFPLQ
jgi:hypothetical protein